MKTLSKAEAIKRNLKTYDGEPCKRGHSGKRFVKGDKCVPCNVERTRKFRERAKTKTGKAAKSKTAPATAGAALVPINSEPISGEVISGEHWRFYADRITATWQKATGSIIETGALLLEAKDKVEHGEFEEMIERELPFGPRAARMLMDIARNPILSDRTHGSVLPPSWRTLYELTRVPADVLIAKIEDHSINPGMERKDVAAITGARHPKTKLRRRSKADERIIEQAEEIKRMTAHIAEIESAREFGLYIDTEDDDDTALAEQIFERIGSERVSRLIAELEKLIRAASEAA